MFRRIEQHAQERPDAVALWQCFAGQEAQATTWVQLVALIRAYSLRLRVFASANDFVGLFLARSADCVAAMLACQEVGKTFVCLNRKLRPPQINAILQGISHASGDTAVPVLTDGPGLMTLASSPEPSSFIAKSRWRVIHDRTFLPPHQRAMDRLRAEQWLDIDMLEKEPGVICENDLRHIYWPSSPSPCTQGEDKSEGPDLPPRSLASLEQDSRSTCCLFTSGSTGQPKGVLIGHGDLKDRAIAETALFGINTGDVLLNVLPFSFDVGLNQLFTVLHSGCALVMLDSFLPADILKTAAQFKVTGISGVPALWLDMLNSGMRFDRTASHAALRYITLSGGDLCVRDMDRLAAMAGGAGIFKTYGQSETFRSSALVPHEFATGGIRRQSVGRPFAGAKFYIVRSDGSLAAAGEEGQIVHTGIGIMLGYLDGSEREGKLLPNPFQSHEDTSPMAIFTGDMGCVDADGYLFVKGRQDAMLKVAGNRIYPAEIAAQILVLPHVIEAEVLGIKSPDGQTEIVAFVVADAAGLSELGLRRELTARLPSYMVPRRVILLQRMPRTANGKPDRPALLQQLESMPYGNQQ